MISGNFRVNESTTRLSQDEEKAQCIGRRCLVLMSVILGLICALLLGIIIWMNITITAERDLVNRYKNTVQEFNHTINSLQTNYTDLTFTKDQLQNFFNLAVQKKMELETRINNLTIDKDQLQEGFDSLSQQKQELESKVTSLSDQLNKDSSQQCGFFLSDEAKSWSESRQFCRDRGADLVMIKTEDKQRCVSSFIKEKVWIGLTDVQTEGQMKWVDNSPLNQAFWEERQPDNFLNEDCIELIPTDPVLNNWNDLFCSLTRRGVCETVS